MVDEIEKALVSALEAIKSGHFVDALNMLLARKAALGDNVAAAALRVAAAFGAGDRKTFFESLEVLMSLRTANTAWNSSALELAVHVLSQRGVVKLLQQESDGEAYQDICLAALVIIHIHMGAFAKAEKCARMLIPSIKGNDMFEVLVSYCRSHFLDPEVILVTREALTQDPNNAQWIAELALASFNQGDIKCTQKLVPRYRELVAEKDRAELASALAEVKNKPLVFLHLPKTGGTSVISAIKDVGVSLGHRIINDGPIGYEDDSYSQVAPGSVERTKLSGAVCFTNVRNIFAFLISYYHDCRRLWLSESSLHDSIVSRKYNFSDFIEYLVEESESWVGEGLINIQVFAQPSGEIAVNWINRLEFLSDDISEMALKFDLNLTRSIGHKNQNVFEDYRTYYTDKLITKVYEKWADDIRLFGFDFDNYYKPDLDVLHHDIGSWSNKIRLSIPDKNVIYLY